MLTFFCSRLSLLLFIGLLPLAAWRLCAEQAIIQPGFKLCRILAWLGLTHPMQHALQNNPVTTARLCHFIQLKEPTAQA